MPVEASDEELLAGCLKGDALSWSVFVERFAGLVHWSIRKSLSAEAQDDLCREIFQEFFERFLDRNELLTLREAGHIRKFLSVSACHLALDRLKAKRRHSRRTLPVDELLLSQTPSTAGDEGLYSDEAAAAMRDVMAQLPPKERACLEFCVVDGRSAREAGLLLGFTEESVRGILRRAKERARTRLKRHGFEEGEK